MDYRDDLVDTFDEHMPSPAERRLMATLQRAYHATPSPTLDARMQAALRTSAVLGGRQMVPARRHLPLPAGRRLIPMGAALALLAGGSLGALRLSGPQPVSAQTVLSRAAAAMRLGPGQAAHLSYDVTIASTPAQIGDAPGSNGPVPSQPQTGGAAAGKGTMLSHADVWVRADAAGVPAQSSQTLSDPANPANGLLARYLQLGQQTYGYIIGRPNWIVIPGSHDQHPGWMIPNAALDGAGVAQDLSALAQRSPQQVQLLPQRTIGGIAVDALQVNGWADAPAMRTTFYFDRGTFLLRGFDAASSDPSYPTPAWRVRLTDYAAVASTALPVDAFALHAPADAQVDPPMIDFAGYASAFQATCRSTLTMDQLVRVVQTRQQTLLAACQATAPAVSADDLVGALLAPYRTTLASAAAVIHLTQPQVDAALAAQHQWLATLVTTPGGGSSVN